MPERVVFDTNIWISGLLWRGKPYRCLLLARGKVVEAVYCQPMAGELLQKLRTAFAFSENHIEAVMYDFRQTCVQVKTSGELHVVADNPDANKFVECAVIAGAKLIVSGDGHLLKLGQYGDIQVISASQFLERMR